MQTEKREELKSYVHSDHFNTFGYLESSMSSTDHITASKFLL